MQTVIKKLSTQHYLKSEVLDQLNSIKEINKQKKKVKDKIIKKVEKEQEDQEEQKLEIGETPKVEIIQQKALPNIFEQFSYINENQQDEQIQISKQKEKEIELDQLAKYTIPDLNIEQHEFEKKLKNQEKKAINRNQQYLEFQKEEETRKETKQIEKDKLKKLSEQLYSFQKDLSIKNYGNQVKRTEEQKQFQEKLPIHLKESEIVDAIQNNLVTLISGETGSGKSTQVPQYLFEAGYSNKNGPFPGKIAITEPRRIAAISLAKRMADELNFTIGNQISYQVRYEASKMNEQSNVIKFMTDGILMREIASDFLLTNYSVLIIDEAHERKINTDLLIGLLSRIVYLRLKLALEERKEQNLETYKFYPLRVVIMSATLRITDFVDNKYLFPNIVSQINVESRQYEVKKIFAKRTPENYLDSAVEKCVKIHEQLPPGDILVFLTGEKEIKEFKIKLEQILKQHTNQMFDKETNNNNQESNEKIKLKYSILPLYSKLPINEQEKIFKSSENTRLIIAATNVAETSITIPNIKYVVDTGKEKKKIYNQRSGIFKYSIDWISQASAEQRAGRAGRVANGSFYLFSTLLFICNLILGYCYRLYSGAVYANDFIDFSQPELIQQQMQLDSVVLSLKSIGIENILKFPFPTMPESNLLLLSIERLLHLKALKLKSNSQTEEDEEDKKNLDETEMTELGKILAVIPVAPRFAKMLLLARQKDILWYGLLLVTFLSVEELFNRQALQISANEVENQMENFNNNNDDYICSDDSQEVLFFYYEDLFYFQRDYQLKKNLKFLEQKSEEMKIISERKREKLNKFKESLKQYYIGHSDLLIGMNILGEFINFITTHNQNNFNIDKLIYEFAQEHNLIFKTLKEVYQVLNQLLSIMEALIENNEEKIKLKEQFSSKYVYPKGKQITNLEDLIISSFIDKVARKIRIQDEKTQKFKYVYEVLENSEYTNIHPFSFLNKEMPDYVAYTSIIQSNKNYLFQVTKISNLKLLRDNDLYAEFNKLEIIYDPQPYYSKKQEKMLIFASSAFGKKKWELNFFEVSCFCNYLSFQTEFEDDSSEKYFWFAKSLLDGQIFNYFQVLKKYYIKETSIIRSTNLQPLVTKLVNTLKFEKIQTQKQLIEKWEKNKMQTYYLRNCLSRFLLPEIKNWVIPDKQSNLEKNWPPCI